MNILDYQTYIDEQHACEREASGMGIDDVATNVDLLAVRMGQMSSEEAIDNYTKRMAERHERSPGGPSVSVMRDIDRVRKGAGLNLLFADVTGALLVQHRVPTVNKETWAMKLVRKLRF